MTWITHITFGSLSAGILGLNPIFAGLGSTAPDWFEDLFGVKEHRGLTHYVVLWLGAFVVSLIVLLMYEGSITMMLFSFVYGGLTHLFLDSLTVTGVPLGVGNIRVRIGGLIRTGKMSEYVFLFVVLIGFLPFWMTGSSFSFFGAKKLYEKGIIDKKEYEELKFKIF
jgi:membrane-bound metal-dependent hydrolase YbcI (DUF457 family)